MVLIIASAFDIPLSNLRHAPIHLPALLVSSTWATIDTTCLWLPQSSPAGGLLGLTTMQITAGGWHPAQTHSIKPKPAIMMRLVWQLPVAMPVAAVQDYTSALEPEFMDRQGACPP